jgi:hypothetical protein
VTERYNIPLEAVVGGPETMYPEYRKKLKDKYVMPPPCKEGCGAPPAPPPPAGRGAGPAPAGRGAGAARRRPRRRATAVAHTRERARSSWRVSVIWLSAFPSRDSIDKTFLIGGRRSRRCFVWSALSFLPDADVIGFSLGVNYGDEWGHRGATHSLMFAIAVGAAVGALAPLFKRPALRTAITAILVVASHPLSTR